MTTLAFAEARSLILEHVAPLDSERVPLQAAAGRVLAGNLVAPRDLPAWDNSAMDGFAVRAADCNGSPLPVVGFIPAGGGSEGIQVRPGTAVKILTGAPVPEGCDTVVPVEETEPDGETVRIRGPVRRGDHIRRRGEDVRAGETVLTAGTVLRPAAVSLLATFGLTAAAVVRRPRVAILATGDELVEPGEETGPGQIVNSNSFALAAAVAEAGGEPILLGIARDDRDSLLEKLRTGLDADILITSAGVSGGDRDLVREILPELGVRELFSGVAVKPGKPTAFGLRGRMPVFSLPGNPIASLVTFEEFVRPALRRMMGHRRPVKPFHRAVLGEGVKKRPGRVHFLRVRIVRSGEGLTALPSGVQQTGLLATLVRADGLAFLPAERGDFAAGESVEVHLLGPETCFEPDPSPI